jgi:hypothetical protein
MNNRTNQVTSLIPGKNTQHNSTERKITFFGQGILLQGHNHSLAIIKPPAISIQSKISQDEINQLLNDRNVERFAKKHNQNGLKMNVGHSIWLKDKNSGLRVLCSPVQNEEVFVNGEQQSVPAFQPSKIYKK